LSLYRAARSVCCQVTFCVGSLERLRAPKFPWCPCESIENASSYRLHVGTYPNLGIVELRVNAIN